MDGMKKLIATVALTSAIVVSLTGCSMAQVPLVGQFFRPNATEITDYMMERVLEIGGGLSVIALADETNAAQFEGHLAELALLIVDAGDRCREIPTVEMAVGEAILVQDGCEYYLTGETK